MNERFLRTSLAVMCIAPTLLLGSLKVVDSANSIAPHRALGRDASTSVHKTSARVLVAPEHTVILASLQGQ
jgi:hypothetical protein